MYSYIKIIILFYYKILLLLLCNEGKSMENLPLKNDENTNVNQFMDLMISHFEHFGTPYKSLELEEYEQGKKQIIKRKVRTRKVEWRLAEINQYTIIKEWTSEFSMLDERNAKIVEKKLASAMKDYAHCVKKMPKMIIKKDEKNRKIFMLNGAITILDMKAIARKEQAYLVNYIPDFSGNEQKLMEALQTHFCTSLFIVIDGKIGEYILVCTRIDRWTEKYDPSKIIGKKAADCGYSELHDNQLLGDEYLKSIGLENMLEFVQIKLAMDLTKILKHFGVDLVDEKHQKKSDHNVPTTSINPVLENEIAIMDPNIRIYKGFIVEYDPRKMVAHWLLERLTHENVFPKNPIQRLNWNWNADPEFTKIFQPDEEDYKIAKQFKLNHGHLAGFRAHREDVDQETFLYPNSVPQDREINSGYWRVIEEYALCLAGHKQSIAYVYTGPLYIPVKEVGQWQMKYKVFGKRKMMAVPTHLFKTILLEFKNDNGKKSFYLETFVVSNGQEGEVEVVEEGNVEGINEVEEDFDVDEKEEEVTVEVEMGNNIWYNLAKDEMEIDKILNKISDKGKVKATTFEGDENVKKINQKLEKGKGKTITTKAYVKKTDRIKTLVEGCQNRQYKINYGDKKLHKISDLLGDHRKPLTYIDKFAPNMQLLAKLPIQLRAGKKDSERKGVHFDEDILSKLLEENKRKEKLKGKKKDNKGNKKKKFSPIKDLVAEIGKSYDEKEEKKSEEREEESTSGSKKSAVGEANRRKKGKNNKDGKKKNKQKQQKQKQQQPASASMVDTGSSTANAAKSGKIKIFEQIEKLYTIYLLKTDLPKDLDEYLFHKIILHTYWHEVQCLFESVKEKMLADDDKVDTAQIDAIEFELSKLLEDILKFDIFSNVNSDESKAKLAMIEGHICLLIHLRESIFYTFMSASSQQKSSTLRNFGLEFEQKRLRDFGIVTKAKGNEYIFSNNEDGIRIAQNWINLARKICIDENMNKYVFYYKLEMQDLLFSRLNELLKKKADFSKELAKFLNKKDNDSDYKLMKILGVHLFKKFMREFKKFPEISPANFQIVYMDIFRWAILDVVLSIGYQNQKYATQEFLYFFDYYAIMKKIEQFHDNYSKEKVKKKSDKEIQIRELRDIGNLKEQLLECRELESKENTKFLGQAVMIKCIRNVYCQMQNLYYKVNSVALDVRQGKNLNYFGGEECDRLISMHGNMFTKMIDSDYEDGNQIIRSLFTEIYDKKRKYLVNWAFNMEMGEKKVFNVEKDEMESKVIWNVHDKKPNYESQFREKQLKKNNRNEFFAENKNFKEYLMTQNNLNYWQTIKSALEFLAIETTMTTLFDALQSPNDKMIDTVEKEKAVKTLNTFGNIQNILALEEIFKQIVEKSQKEEIKPLESICQLLVLRQHLHISIEKMGDEKLKSYPELQEFIEQYGQIPKSNFPFDEEEFVGLPITMDVLERNCQPAERREKLLWKYRHEVENLMADQLNMIFFTNAIGMEDYHLVVDLPAKLIKIVGIKGFRKIAKNHPLIMKNFFNMETIYAILFHLKNADEQKGNQQQNFENIERTDEEREKHLIMLDSILFHLTLQNPTIEEISAGKQAKMAKNEELEKSYKIERAITDGMDILIEWLDNNDKEKKNKNHMITKEEIVKQNELDEKAQNELDEEAYLAIGRLIVRTIIENEEHTIPGFEIDIVASEKATDRDHMENKLKQWRNLTLAKLMELEEEKKNYDKGKEK